MKTKGIMVTTIHIHAEVEFECGDGPVEVTAITAEAHAADGTIDFKDKVAMTEETAEQLKRVLLDAAVANVAAQSRKNLGPLAPIVEIHNAILPLPTDKKNLH